MKDSGKVTWFLNIEYKDNILFEKESEFLMKNLY